jgi:crotonobetainyl-CoA:carnitine CoA-transferase CaiB-like acyl-CoA transferase
VQNLRPGAMDGLGLDAESLRAANPRLIYCSLHAFGREGPMRLHPGYEPIVQAFAGMFSVNGTREGPPARVGMQVLDLGTGVWAALGCLAALLRRAQTGAGSVVDTSLFETALGWLTIHFAAFGASGRHPVRDRTGNPRLIVLQAFETSDGELVVAAANDRLFAKLAIKLGRPEWANDPCFRTNADRIAHRELLIPEMEAIFRARPTAEWVRRLEALAIPCSPINDLGAVAADPQTAAISALAPLPDLPELRTVGLPVSFDGVRPPHRHRAPALGADNEALGAPVPETR